MNPAERGRTLLGFLAGVAALLTMRPYQGIYHDAVLYTAQALRSGGAQALEEDLAFHFGSQHSFSIFDLGYAPLVAALGPSGGHLAAWLLGLAIWVAALIALLRALRFGAVDLPVLVVGLFLMVPAYGNGALHYAEGIVTPRIFSEAAALLSLALVMRGRTVAGGGAWLLSAALHPIMAFAVGIAVLRLWVRGVYSFLLGLAGGALGAVGLGLVGIVPFDGLGRRFDQEWAAILHDPVDVVFPQYWPGASITLLTVPLVALLVVARGAPGRMRDLARACLWAAGLAVALSVLGTAMLEDRMITALQPWRGLWLLVLVGNIAVLHLALSGAAGAWWWFVIVASVFDHLLDVAPIASSLSVLAPLLAQIPVSTRNWMAALGAALGLLALAGVVQALRPEGDVWLRLAVGFAVLVVVSVKRVSLLARMAAAACAAVLAIAVFADARDPWRRWVDTETLPPEIEEAVRDSTVYWEGALLPMWIRAGAPQYFSCSQRNGNVFQRAQAIEFQRRAEALRSLGTGDFQMAENANRCPVGAETKRARDAATLRAVCDTLPELDLIVLLSDDGAGQGRVWSLPIKTGPYVSGVWWPASENSADSTYWRVHDCRDLRPK